MGRTNGKLIPFLLNALESESFDNLKWIDKMSLSFKLFFPRFEKRKDLQRYENILVKWYSVNERKYHGYSKAKAVIKAALKKSVYIVSLQSNSHELCFRFATKDETEAKKRKQKGQSNLILYDPLLNASEMLSPSPSSVHSPNPPLSDSSGYFSESEDFEESVELFAENSTLENFDFDFDIFTNPEKSIDDIIRNNISSCDTIENNGKTVPQNLEPSGKNITMENVNLKNSKELIPQENIKLNDVELMHQSYKIKDEEPVVELMATVINSSQVLKTYWLCTKKLIIDSTLLLICEKQVIQEENEGILPGQVCLNNVLEPGEKYKVQKNFEFDGKYFLFLLPDN